MPYFNYKEMLFTEGWLLGVLSDIGIRLKDINTIKVKEVGYGGFSSIFLKDMFDEFSVIDPYVENVVEGVNLEKVDATTADLSGLDLVITLGLPAFSLPDNPEIGMKTANALARNAEKHNVKYLVTSPGITEPGKYNLFRDAEINDKVLCIYTL